MVKQYAQEVAELSALNNKLQESENVLQKDLDSLQDEFDREFTKQRIM